MKKLLLMLLCLGAASCGPRAQEFHYLESVVVTDGFYSGCYGIVLSRGLNFFPVGTVHYSVAIKCKDETFPHEEYIAANDMRSAENEIKKVDK